MGDSKVSIEIFNNLVNHICKYATLLVENLEYSVHKIKFTNDMDEAEVELRIPYGKTEINFLGSKIVIDFIRDLENPVGSSYNALCYERMYLKTNAFKNREKNLALLQKFIIKSWEHISTKKINTVVCKIYKMNLWVTLSKLPKRRIESVYLDKNLQEQVLGDVKKFIGDEKIYLKHGIPYKRNYLFYGIPGSGKTSLIYAIASELDRNICILNFTPEMNDTLLHTAISSLPKNSILLLEDIDALFVNRKSSSENKSYLSFSALLNVLDGIGRKHGLLTFMTSNYREKLEAALVRPGRIDYSLEFTYATTEQVKMMYQNLLEPDNQPYLEKFLEKVQRLKTTTSVLQKFFFEHRDCENILGKVKELRKLSEEACPKEYSSMYA